MDLSNEFEVDAPIDQAWTVLTDVERIAPCLPGAQLQEVEGDEYRGIVKVKVGPITAQYKGQATFVERDEAAKRVKLKADGRDTRGAGNASALITAQLVDLGGRTKVTVDTDLTITGKVAQFGRGVIADVSAKLMGQFADNLGELLEKDGVAAAAGTASSEAAAAPAPTTAPPAAAPASPSAAPASTAAPAGAPTQASSGVRKIDMPEPEAVDLLDTAGAPVLKRVAPLVVLVVVLLLVRRWLRGRGEA